MCTVNVRIYNCYFSHVKAHHLYDSLRRRSALYDSQELRMDFGEEYASRISTFRRNRYKDDEIPLEGSFGTGVVNMAYTNDDDNGPKTPTWSANDTPRIPRWNTSDSLKDAIQSLEDLTTRLNAEDNISGVTSLSRERRSQKSNKSVTGSTPNSVPVTPRSDIGNSETIKSNPELDDDETCIRTEKDETQKEVESEKTMPPVDYPVDGDCDSTEQNTPDKHIPDHVYVNHNDHAAYTEANIVEESTAF